MRKQHGMHDGPGARTIVGSVLVVILFVTLMVLAACVSTPQVAKDINDLSIKKVCTVFQPVTDTTSKQVRANNRARYALCDTLEKKK